MIIRRYLPDGSYEDWNLDELTSKIVLVAGEAERARCLSSGV